MLVFILSIISICLVFLMKSFLGTLLAIIALIIALVQWKKKKVINYIGFALSLLLILLFVKLSETKLSIYVTQKNF